jgi:hypothetical protein
VTTVTLRRARPDEASMLRDLALAARDSGATTRHSSSRAGTSAPFGPDDIARRYFVVADLGGLVAGCYSVDGDPPVGELGNMWIRPSKIGTGLGPVLRQDAMPRIADRVRQAQW